jgi:hypothetical protein
LALFVDADELRRVEIEADDVAQFSTNCGSVESLNVSVRCGCSEKACQIRCTVEADTPDAFAIPRVLQCVASFGFVSSVLVMISSIQSSPIWRATSRLVVEAIQPMLYKPFAPCANGLAVNANDIGDLTVIQPVGGVQNDLGPLGISARNLAAPNETLENIALVFTELDRARLPRPSSHHRPLRITTRIERITLRFWCPGFSETGH